MVFDTLKDFVDTIAEGLVTAIEAAAKTAIAAIDTAYNVYKSAIAIALAAVKGIVTGDFKDLGNALLEAALDIAGITDADFRNVHLKVQRAIKLIIADPNNSSKTSLLWQRRIPTVQGQLR